MIDISCIDNKNRINQASISLCGKLEAYIGRYFLSNVLPDSEVETLYYDATIAGIYDEVDTVEKNIVAYFVNNETIAFVKHEIFEKLQKETEEYGIYYIMVDDFDEEVLTVNKDLELPAYLKNILWIDDDFLSDESIPFNYDAFDIIDSKVDYLNPKHFSVRQLVRALKS